MDLNVKGKAGLIMGGGEGIGRLVALMMAEEGADVAVTDVNGAKAESVAEEIRSNGVSSLSIPVDVIEGHQVNHAVEQVLSQFGRIDFLAHIPGRGERKGFLETTRADWDFSIQLNLYGPLNSIAAVVKHMVGRKSGKIVTIISDAGKVGEPKNCVYSAAKAGIAGFTKALAQEVGPSNININCISLAMTHTPAFERTGEEIAKAHGMDIKQLENKVLRKYPLRRAGEPQDVANAVCFLLSDRAKHITGQTLNVDGGYCMI